MDPNQTNHPSQIPEDPDLVHGPEYEVETHNEIEETKKVSRRLLFIVAFFLAILIPAGLYFYTKNKSAVSYQNTIATPIPTAQPTSTPDPTANWQTYTNKSYNFSFKYPKTWNLKEFSQNDAMPLGYILRIGTSSKSTNFSDYSADLSTSSLATNQTLEEFAKASLISNIASKEAKLSINGIESIWQEAMYGQGNYDVKIYIPNGQNVFIFDIPNPNSPNSLQKEDAINLDTFRQILSTFKFTSSNTSPSPSSSPSQVICTQEAKACPDGSYVGRSGPNCEFAACPGSQ